MRFSYAVSIGGPALAAILMLSATPANVSTASPRPASSATFAAPAPATPTNGLVHELFGGDSCVDASNWSSSPFWCLAAGYRADLNGETAVGLSWSQGASSPWNGYYPSEVPNSPVNFPFEVSCTAPDAGAPTCAMVGEHFRNPRYAAQLAEVSSAGGQFNILAHKSPADSTWSRLLDVSCPTSTFCQMVGDAGTSRKTSRGIVYTSHATAYIWTGGATLTKLSPPAPAHARTSELAGVSCATATDCLAVGNYTNAKGRSLTYSDAWHSGTWTVQHALNAHGQASTTLQAVACLSTTACMAVGYSAGPGSHAVAQEWSGGAWQSSATPAENNAGLTSVTCPSATSCYASGSHGQRALIESWNGASWSVQKLPATKAPLSADVLLHVSCVTTTECLAVGYRFNPKFSLGTTRYLAEVFTGSGWQVRNP